MKLQRSSTNFPSTETILNWFASLHLSGEIFLFLFLSGRVGRGGNGLVVRCKSGGGRSLRRWRGVSLVAQGLIGIRHCLWPSPLYFAQSVFPSWLVIPPLPFPLLFFNMEYRGGIFSSTSLSEFFCRLVFFLLFLLLLLLLLLFPFLFVLSLLLVMLLFLLLQQFHVLILHLLWPLQGLLLLRWWYILLRWGVHVLMVDSSAYSEYYW